MRHPLCVTRISWPDTGCSILVSRRAPVAEHDDGHGTLTTAWEVPPQVILEVEEWCGTSDEADLVRALEEVYRLPGALGPRAEFSGAMWRWLTGGVLNLTQHAGSAEQVAEGVVEPGDKARVRELLTLTVDESDDVNVLHERAKALVDIARAEGVRRVMVGGEFSLTVVLVRRLARAGFQPVLALSERVSVDGPDGKKTSVFKHRGFKSATLGMGDL